MEKWNIILSKALSVLPETELPKPVRNLLHRGDHHHRQFSSPMLGWFTGRSARSSLNISPPGSSTRWDRHIGNGWAADCCLSSPPAAYQATGSVRYALIYPIAVPAVCMVLSLFLMPETRKISIWNPETKTA